MSDIAIRVNDLGKLYHIGGPQARYKTIRESITDGVKAPFRRAGRVLRGQAHGASDLDQTIWALKDVSFEVKHGEVVGIIGRNGAGKSTLLKVIARITEPTEGEVMLRGRVGSLLEVGTGFHPELTGRENLFLNGAILGMRRLEIDQKFDEIIEFAELENFLDTPVKHYSSGMYVRLAFSVAAHLEPNILVVDEVLAVGDIAFQKKCLGKMGDVAKSGRTVLFVSHDMAAVTSLCNRAIILENGRAIADDSVESSVQNYLSRVMSGHGQDLRAEISRWGSGAVRFTGVGFTIPGVRETGDSLVSGLPAEIHLAYKTSDGISLRNADFTITVVNQFGHKVFSCATFLTGQKLQFQRSEGRLACSIPALPLTSGQYTVNLHCEISGQAADHVDSAATFYVERRDVLGSGKLPKTRKHGSVIVDHEWSVE